MLAAGLSGVLVLGGALLTPAAAATGGSAEAQSLDVQLLPVDGLSDGVSVTTEFATAPDENGTDTQQAVDLDAGGVTASELTATATRTADSLEASSEISDLRIELAGGTLLSADSVTAEVACTVDEDASADTTVTGLEVLGESVTLDEAVAGVEAEIPGVADLFVTLLQVEEGGPDGALAVAVLAEVSYTLLGDQDPESLGVFMLGGAFCIPPTAADGAQQAPVVSALDPQRGPVAGGTEVTVTGEGFVAGETSVTIGGRTVPAGDVEVAESGTLLTFTTPEHDAGEVPVTVTTPDGTSEPLTFTYVGEAPVTPAPVTPAPVTPAPVTPAPVTTAPVAAAPVAPAARIGGGGVGSGDTAEDESSEQSLSTLPRTGSNVTTLALLAVLALIVGAAARVLGARRTS